MMKTTNKMLVISALAALSFGMAACDDDASGTSGDACSVKCDGTVAIACTDGKEVRTDCKDSGKVCNSGQCVDKSQADKCLEMCNGNTLVTCVDDKPQQEDCGDAECKMVGDKYQCVDGGNTPEPSCTEADNKCDGDNRVTCVDGKLKTDPCGTNQTCDAATVTCVDKDVTPQCDADSFKTECISATAYQVCEAGTLKTVSCDKCENGACVIDNTSVIGTPCTCTADSCTKTITGSEIKAIPTQMVSTALLLLGLDDELFERINDNDTISYPDFFSADIKGCENVTAPAGMTVGCLRDSTIKADNYETSSWKRLVEVLANNEKLGDKIKPFMTIITDIMNTGIQFKSSEGYCLAAAIDVNLDIPSDSMLAMAVNSQNLSALLGKMNTGDHGKAKLDSTACPAGSVKFVYDVDKELSFDLLGSGTPTKLANAKVGFDMCLKSCLADSDCRTGYKCIDIPNGVPADGETQVYTKACFDEANITYFEAMTQKFNNGQN